MKLSALRLFVEDLASARDFYQRVLGLRLTYDGYEHGYCSFESAGINVIGEAVPPNASSEDRLAGRFIGASFAVDDIHAEYERLKTQGVSFSGAPEKQFWGGMLATFLDPSGNQLQLVQYAI